MIVVLDSGIWISAFQFGGTPQTALDTAFSHNEIAICDQIIAEVRATLTRKFYWNDAEVLDILSEYTNDAVHVEISGLLHGICRDPKDDMIFECAVKADAELIISGDLDLLTVKTYSGIRVLTARQYLDQTTAQSP